MIFDLIAIFILIPLASAGGFAVGYIRCRNTQVDYHRRWKEALELLEAERTKTLAGLDTPPRGSGEVVHTPSRTPVQDAYKKAKLVEQLLEMYDDDREEMEEQRLQYGLPPIDPLTELYSDTYKKMIKRRFEWGYDENGDRR